jgi:hypothetical protein
MAESASVKVYARFRPLNKREIALNADACSNLQFINGNAGVSVEGKPFNFDRCFGTDTQQDDFYDTVAKSTIDDIFKGYNGTIFAYGQTGAGKTFSMMGVMEDERLRGITPRAMKQIFDTIEAAPMEVTFKVSVCYLEVQPLGPRVAGARHLRGRRHHHVRTLLRPIPLREIVRPPPPLLPPPPPPPLLLLLLLLLLRA